MASVIVGVLGLKRAGKDTFAGRLVERHGFTRLAFADALKDMALDINPVISAGNSLTLREVVRYRGWDDAKSQPLVREFLQNLGVAARKHVDEDVWVDIVMRQAAEILGPVVIPDVRFENEALAVEESRGALVRVVRRHQLASTHESEINMYLREVTMQVTADAGDTAKLHKEADFLAGALGVRAAA